MADETEQLDPPRPGSAVPLEDDGEIESLLRAWRARALHVLLIVIVVASLPAYILTLSNAIRSGQISAAVWVYPAVYIAFVVLAGLPRLDFGLRAWSLLLLCDANAWASFARNGLAGSGRLYLIVVPIVATVLLGSPAGYLFAALSLAIYAVFALLAHFGALGQWLTVEANPLALAYWAEAGVALAAFLVVVVVLLDRLFRLQRRVLAARRQAVAESMRTALALQTAYQTLERRVEERTHALATLNAIASTVSRSLDLEAILSDALDKTLEVIGAPAGAAYCLEDATQTFVLAAHRGLPDPVLQISNRNPLVMALGGKTLTQAAPVIWDVATDYPPGLLKESMQAEGLSTVIGIPLVAKERLVGCLSLSTRASRSLAPEEAALLMAIGQQIGVATENPRLYKSEYERHEDAERRQQVAEGMREILVVLNSRQSLDEALNSIVAQACRLLNCDAAVLFRLGPDRFLRMQASCGLDAEYTSSLSLPFGQGGSGRALAERRAVPLPDVAAYARYLAYECPDLTSERTSLEQLLKRGIGALLSVPLVVRDEDYGAITLYYRTARDFTEEEMRLALSVANQAALAIESARLREQAQAAAALAERSRLARELHDSVTQSIYSVTLYAEAAARLLSSGEHVQAAEYLRDLRDTSLEALREMRLLVFELRPPALEQVGLAGALEARLKAVEARGGMTTELRVDGAGPAAWLSLEDQQEIYNIAQEALNNAFKHARAKRVSVRLQYAGEEARLIVSDNGSGFDLIAARACGGMGLAGMAERANRIAANLDIDSRPGAGTTVTVTVCQQRLGPAGTENDT